MKPFFLLIVCICFFVSVSCICAADGDDAMLASQSTMDDGIDDNCNLPIADLDNSQDSCSSDMQVSADDSIVFKNHTSPVKNESHFANGDKRPTRNMSDKAMPQPKNPHNPKKVMGFRGLADDSIGAMSRPQPRHPHDDRPLYNHESHAGNAEREHTPHSVSPDAERPDVKRTEINTDIARHIYANTTKSFDMAQTHDTKVTMKSEVCMCHDGKCDSKLNHHHHHSDCAVCREISPDSLISNDLTCSYSYFYTQINTASEDIIRSRNLDEENELDDEKNRRFKSIQVHVYGHDINQPIGENGSSTPAEPSHMDLDNASADLFCGDASQFNCIGLDIDGLYALDLDIKDYNLEFYMFSNPDIIIKANISSLPKTNALIFNTDFYHCPENADAKSNPDSYLIFTYELSPISQDNYAPTFSQDVSLLNEMNDLMLIKTNGFSGQSPVNRVPDENAISYIFGGILRCLI